MVYKRRKKGGNDDDEGDNNNGAWITLVILIVLSIAVGLGIYFMTSSDGSGSGGGNDDYDDGKVDLSEADAAGCRGSGSGSGSGQYYESPIQSAVSGRGTEGGCVDNITSCQPWETMTTYGGSGSGGGDTTTPNGTLLKNGANRCDPKHTTVFCGAVPASGLVWAVWDGADRCVVQGGDSIMTDESMSIVPIKAGSSNLGQALGYCPAPTSSDTWTVSSSHFTTNDNGTDFAHGVTQLGIPSAMLNTAEGCDNSRSDGGDACTILKCTYAKK